MSVLTANTTPMNEEQKTKYYRSEILGSPIIDHINFRCQKRLAVFLRTQALLENRDVSMIIRRYLHWAASQEGYKQDGA